MKNDKMRSLARRMRRFFDWFRIGRPVLDYVEFQLDDRCNLNCTGCSHYSPLVKESPEDFSYATISAVQTLAEKFSLIRHVRIVGGEPLLCDNLLDVIQEIRSSMPRSRIAVVTNGMLLLSKDKEWLARCRQLDVKFSFSVYPPVRKKSAEIIERVSAAGVEIHAIECNEFQAKIDLAAEGCARKRFAHCRARTYCPFLRGTRIYSCAESALAFYFNEEFDEHLPVCVGLDVASSSGRQILRYLMTPVAHCAYCKETQRTFKWCQSERRKEEWLA